jgi:hypothetical protein
MKWGGLSGVYSLIYGWVVGEGNESEAGIEFLGLDDIIYSHGQLDRCSLNPKAMNGFYSSPFI